MKSLFHIAASAALLLSTASSKAVTIYTTNFDEFDPGNAISNQDNWTTDDTYNAATSSGQSDGARIVNGYSLTNADYWAVLGGLTGLAPGKLNVNLWKPFSTAGILAQTPSASDLQFSVEASISGSVIPRPNHDSFGWSFRDSFGLPLFQLSLDYNATNDSLKLNFVNGAGVSTSTTFGVYYDSTYTYIFDANVANTSIDTISLSLRDAAGKVTKVINNQALPEGTVFQIAQIAEVWKITNSALDANGHPTQYGNNSMLTQNYSIDVIPEPGSGLCLLGGLGLCLARRRRG